VPHDVRDQIVDFVRRWSEASEIGAGRFVGWLGVSSSKFYDWRERYGRVNEHNGWVPRDFWLEDWEKQAIINFHLKNPLEGYRRLTFMMLDADIVAVSPSSVWRVLGQEGLLKKWNGKPSKKGTGFEQPPQPHQHWHIDVSYINISGTFYYLCSVLDGCSRTIVHWDLRESMTEAEIEIILQGAKEKHPEAKPRIISQPWMGIQREMRTVNRQIIFQQQPQELVTLSRPWVGRPPKKPMMDQQKISAGADRQTHSGKRGVHGGGNSSDRAVVFGLQSVDRPVVIFNLGSAQKLVAMADDGGKRNFRHWVYGSRREVYEVSQLRAPLCVRQCLLRDRLLVSCRINSPRANHVHRRGHGKRQARPGGQRRANPGRQRRAGHRPQRHHRQ